MMNSHSVKTSNIILLVCITIALAWTLAFQWMTASVIRDSRDGKVSYFGRMEVQNKQ